MAGLRQRITTKVSDGGGQALAGSPKASARRHSLHWLVRRGSPLKPGMILGKPLLESSDVPWKQHDGRRADGGQRVCVRIEEWIGGQAGLRASRAEVVSTHGWTGHHALPTDGEPSMQDGGDMNLRFPALTSVTQHRYRYLAELLIQQTIGSFSRGLLETSEPFHAQQLNRFGAAPSTPQFNGKLTEPSRAEPNAETQRVRRNAEPKAHTVSANLCTAIAEIVRRLRTICQAVEFYPPSSILHPRRAPVQLRLRRTPYRYSATPARAVVAAPGDGRAGENLTCASV